MISDPELALRRLPRGVVNSIGPLLAAFFVWVVLYTGALRYFGGLVDLAFQRFAQGVAGQEVAH